MMAVQVTFGTPNRVHEKVWEVPFSGPDGKAAPYPLKYGASTPFVDKIKEGLTAEVEIEKKENSYTKGTDHWIKTLDGEGIRGGGNRGGGGGSKYVPKTALEIHASCVAGVIKSCLDNAIAKPEDINEILNKCYWAQMEKAK